MEPEEMPMPGTPEFQEWLGEKLQQMMGDMSEVMGNITQLKAELAMVQARNTFMRVVLDHSELMEPEHVQLVVEYAKAGLEYNELMMLLVATLSEPQTS